MYTFYFIFGFIIVNVIIGTLMINSYRQLIIMYRIFGKAKKRDIHKQPIPNSCGVVFLVLSMLSIIVLESFFDKTELVGFIVTGTLICIIGFWDDLKIINTYKKLIYQLLIISFVVVHNDLEIQNLYGFLGIHELNPILGHMFSIFIGVFMINSFNLIDGIDGLAGAIAVISFVSFGIVFWILDDKQHFGVCIAMVGIILAYLPFNFSTKRKVFMGDSGALFIGFILFMMTMSVVNTSAPIAYNLTIDRFVIPIIPLAIFIVPIVDTSSIYLYRILLGKSPFLPDKLHLHHKFLLLTKSHLLATLTIVSLNIIVIATFALAVFKLNSIAFITSYFVFLLCVFLLSIFLKYRYKKELNGY